MDTLQTTKSNSILENKTVNLNYSVARHTWWEMCRHLDNALSFLTAQIQGKKQTWRRVNMTQSGRTPAETKQAAATL